MKCLRISRIANELLVINMAAPTGNKFWMTRTKHGRDKLFSSPDALWDACCEYFQWVEDNPLWEVKAFAFQGVVTQEPIPKMRAMTIGGLCIFLGIGRSTWTDWKTNKDFSAVVARAEEVMRDQKFSGAAAELLNPNIIARDLGLTDKQEIEHQGANGTALFPQAIIICGPDENEKE